MPLKDPTAAVTALFHESEKGAMVYSYNREYGTIKPREIFSVDQAGGGQEAVARNEAANRLRQMDEILHLKHSD